MHRNCCHRSCLDPHSEVNRKKQKQTKVAMIFRAKRARAVWLAILWSVPSGGVSHKRLPHAIVLRSVWGHLQARVHARFARYPFPYVYLLSDQATTIASLCQLIKSPILSFWPLIPITRARQRYRAHSRTADRYLWISPNFIKTFIVKPRQVTCSIEQVMHHILLINTFG